MFCRILIDIHRRKTKKVVWSKKIEEHWVKQSETSFAISVFLTVFSVYCKAKYSSHFLPGSKYENNLGSFSK